MYICCRVFLKNIEPSMRKIGGGSLEAWYSAKVTYQDRWINNRILTKTISILSFFCYWLFECHPFVIGTPSCGIHYIYL
jgi:hypothetical protein